MKIVIVGPGAIGSLLAAHLLKLNTSSKQEEKNSIWLLDYKEERAEKIANLGLNIEGISGNWQVKPNISADVNEIGPADIFIICVKSYDTKKAAESIRPIIKDSSAILTLQNGMGNVEIIAETAGLDKVIAGTTNLAATLLDSGKVRFTGKGETTIGRTDSKMTVQMRSIRNLFNSAGLETKISRDIKGLIWSKLIINSAINPLTAILHLNNGSLTELEATRRIMREAVTESVRIAKRKRIKLSFDDPLAKVEAVAEATSANISSMLADVLRKKRTEIDSINGVIVRQGKELNIPVPVNQMLLDLVKAIESSYSKSLY